MLAYRSSEVPYCWQKNEVAHTAKYVPLLQFGCTLMSLRRGANATNTTECFIQEFLNVIASQIEGNLISQFQSSTYIALICDQITDISVLKQMVIYGR